MAGKGDHACKVYRLGGIQPDEGELVANAIENGEFRVESGEFSTRKLVWIATGETQPVYVEYHTISGRTTLYRMEYGYTDEKITEACKRRWGQDDNA